MRTLTPEERRKQQYLQVRERLDNDVDFRWLATHDTGAALRYLLSDPSLPGESARERVDFVLDYTRWIGNMQFRKLPGAVFNDSGFKEDVQDGALFIQASKTNNQLGHFMTAVGLGMKPRNGFLSNATYEFYKMSALGHEMLGDSPFTLFFLPQAARQTATGLSALSEQKAAFQAAIEAAKRGDRDAVKANVARALPKDTPSAPIEGTGVKATLKRWERDWNHLGNSHQDLRLTAFGYGLGQLLDEGKVRTREQLLEYLDTRVLAPLTDEASLRTNRCSASTAAEKAAPPPVQAPSTDTAEAIAAGVLWSLPLLGVP